MMIADLENGLLPKRDSQMDAQEAWHWYRALEPFEFVSYKQFEKQLAQHRSEVVKDDKGVKRAAMAFDHDRKLDAQATHKPNGRPLFYLSEAKKKLEEDVLNERQQGLNTEAFRHTRSEYMEWTLEEFRPRVYQEVRRRRWFNAMEDKRNAAEEKKKKKWQRFREAERKKKEKKEKKKKTAEEKKKADEEKTKKAKEAAKEATKNAIDEALKEAGVKPQKQRKKPRKRAADDNSE